MQEQMALVMQALARIKGDGGRTAKRINEPWKLGTKINATEKKMEEVQDQVCEMVGTVSALEAEIVSIKAYQEEAKTALPIIIKCWPIQEEKMTTGKPPSTSSACRPSEQEGREVLASLANLRGESCESCPYLPD